MWQKFFLVKTNDGGPSTIHHAKKEWLDERQKQARNDGNESRPFRVFLALSQVSIASFQFFCILVNIDPPPSH